MAQYIDRRSTITLPLQGNNRLSVVLADNLPAALRGFALDRGAGQYAVYINAALSDEQQIKTFLHEVTHVLLGHFQRGTTAENEKTAHDRAALLFDMWVQGGSSLELELLEQWIKKRGQVVPLRV